MIGARTPMTDSRERVTGEIGYVINAEPAGTLHAAVARSTVPHARLVRVDVSKAAAHPGVVLVLTGADIAASPVRPYFGPVFRDQSPLAIGKVRYAGEPVAAVVAADLRAATEAAALVEVTYERLLAAFTPADALADGAPLLHEDFARAPGFGDIVLQGQTGNVCNKFQLRKGEGLGGFQYADRIFTHDFTTPSVQHVSLETHAAIATWEGTRLIVTSCTQTPYTVRDTLAHTFDLPVSRVRVIVPPVGGGFGGKTYPKVEPLAALLAQRTGHPVKIVLTREEEFLTNSKHQSFIRLRTGVRAGGTIVARQVDALFNVGAYTDISPRLIKNDSYGAVGPYRIPHVHVDSLAVYTNLPSSGAYRGYGVAQGAWAYETRMDIIAAELGIDPVELRRRNLLRECDTFATGEELHDVRFDEVLDDALTLFDQPDPEPPEPGVLRGRGCAVIIKSTITPSTSGATVKVDADGSLQVLTSTVELGQGGHTALAQMAAGELGIDVARVHVVGPETDVTPYDLTTSSSRSTAAMGSAVRDAKGTLLDLAAQQLEAAPGDLELAGGVVRVLGDPDSARSIAYVVSRSRMGTVLGHGTFMSQGGLNPETGQGIASDHWHQGAVAAEVDVDTRTGKVRVRRLRAAVYAFTVVNPLNARMQLDGSVAFGISQALFEQIIHEAGHVANANLSDYAIAGRLDLPEVMEVSLIENPDSDIIHGLSAIANATGLRYFAIPMTAEWVLDAQAARDE